MKAHFHYLEPIVCVLLICGVVAWSAPAQRPKPETANLCSVEGQVLDAVTNAPVRKALLTLVRASSAPGGRPEFLPTTTSDAAGAFVFRDLQPGSYSLAAGAAGYVLLTDYKARQPRRAGTLFSLAPGQKLTGIALRLTRNSAVSGRIVDEDGDPLSSVQVQLLQVSYRSGRRALVIELDRKATTDDRGLYRIWGVAPGKYYLSAAYPRQAQPTEDAGYVPTYYPGTIDEAAAVPIDMSPGAELENINLRLSKVHTVRIRGRVLDVVSAEVQLRRESIVSGDARNYVNASVGPNGQFEFRGVLPGGYTLLARTLDVERRVSAPRSVTVGAADLDGLTISVLPAILITGHVAVDGESETDLSKARVGLAPAYPSTDASGPPSVTAAKDGTFRIAGVTPDRYRVRTAPDGFYLKTVRLGGRDLPGHILDASAGAPAPIEVVLSPQVASVTGTVSLADSDEPAAEVTVVLIPQEKERRNDELAYLRTRTDESGKFVIRNIAPGEYKAFAWEDVEYGIYMDADFMRPIESKGLAVTLPESARISIKLMAIAAGAP